MINIKMRELTWLWCWSMKSRGVAGDRIYVVVHRENRGGMITEERSDMMMMVVVPTQIFQQETNHLSGYCFPSLISNFKNLTSNVWKGVLGYFWIEVNDVDEHQLFGGRWLLTMSWHIWKASDNFFWRFNFRVAFFFAVYFFASSFSILLSSTSLHCVTLAAVRCIPVL